MITHDIDAALLLADKILLMTNGPNAWIAEVMENSLPATRLRIELHKQPAYYTLRSHGLSSGTLKGACGSSRNASQRPAPATGPSYVSSYGWPCPHDLRTIARANAATDRPRSCFRGIIALRAERAAGARPGCESLFPRPSKSTE